MTTLLLQLFIAIGVLLLVPTKAELSPTAYQELKDAASEVLSINATAIENVTGTTEGDSCTLYFIVDAIVLDVNRSSLRLSVNETIQFEAYVFDRSTAECEVILGPGAPPLLEDGWCGLVYLNPSEEEGSDVLEPAAYGQSFEEYSAEQCQAIAESGTSEENNPAPPSTTSDGSSFSMYRMLILSLPVTMWVTLS